MFLQSSPHWRQSCLRRGHCSSGWPPPPSGCRLEAGGNPHKIHPLLAHESSTVDLEESTSPPILVSFFACEGMARPLSQGGRGFREILRASQSPWRLCSVHTRRERAALTAAGPNVSRKPASRVRRCPVSSAMPSTQHHRCGPLFHRPNHTATRCADTADPTNRTAAPARGGRAAPGRNPLSAHDPSSS